MKEKMTYAAEGLVYGNLWGGGEGIYKMKKLQAPCLKQLIAKAQEMLDDNTLDDGMGFESLQGALLDIEITREIVHNGKVYKNHEYDTQVIGHLQQDQEEQLIQMFMYQ